MTSINQNTHNFTVVGYDIFDDRVTLEFSDGSKYLYTYASAGISNIEKIKLFAEQKTNDLTHFVNTTV
ncbi:MAG: hypothetical protein WHU93_09225, partial [Arcobacteraceae bacterium]